MMMRQLFLPLHQAHTLITGQATRLFVRVNKGDAVGLRDEGWLLTDADGYVRFAVGDSIAIGGPQVGHVCTVKITRLSDMPLLLANLSHAAAREHGYDDVTDLWQDFGSRYDHIAHKHWMYCKRHINRHSRADVFRSLLKTRNPHVWTAWTLNVVLESVNVNVQKTGQAS